MVGNVAEWTSSWFEPYPGNKAKNTFDFLLQYAKLLQPGAQDRYGDVIGWHPDRTCGG